MATDSMPEAASSSSEFSKTGLDSPCELVIVWSGRCRSAGLAAVMTAFVGFMGMRSGWILQRNTAVSIRDDRWYQVFLTASAAGSAAGVITFGRDAANIFGEAVGVLVGEAEGEGVVAIEFGRCERKVSEAGVVVFDLDGKGVGRNDGFSVNEDLSEFVAVDAVIDVGGDPDLKETFPLGVDFAATVDEFFFGESDFGDVEMGRNL